jgi:hypothetical protein
MERTSMRINVTETDAFVLLALATRELSSVIRSGAGTSITVIWVLVDVPAAIGLRSLAALRPAGVAGMRAPL